MGEDGTAHLHQPPSAGQGSSYTKDGFVCGLCGHNCFHIDDYVAHMMLVERCVLHLCPSTCVRDLLLPRFSKKQRVEEGDSKHTQELAAVVRREGRDVEEADVKVAIQASEVETGGRKRWKCHLCGLTFSREAAILNHHKLQHMGGPVLDEAVKSEGGPGPPSPVKLIVAVSSRPLQPQSGLYEDSKALLQAGLYQDCKTHLHSNTFGASRVPTGLEEDTKAHLLAADSKVALQDCKAHLQPAHSTTISSTRHCHICQQQFSSGKGLRTHMAGVHGQPRFSCSYCDTAFKTKGSLKRHERRHTGERPFVCPRCGRRFRESGSLVRHRQARVSCLAKTDAQIPLYGKTLQFRPPSDSKPSIQDTISPILKQEESVTAASQIPQVLPGQPPHSPSGQLPSFIPNQSGDPTGQSSDQSSHPTSDHHPQPTSGQPPQPHLLPSLSVQTPTSQAPRLTPCRTCNKVYKSKSARNMHERTHTGDRAFLCPHCPKNFFTRASLIRHLRVHTGEAPFRCQFCCREFKEHGTLSRHLRNKMPCAGQHKLKQECGEVGIQLVQPTSTTGQLVQLPPSLEQTPTSQLPPTSTQQPTNDLMGEVLTMAASPHDTQDHQGFGQTPSLLLAADPPSPDPELFLFV